MLFLKIMNRLSRFLSNRFTITTAVVGTAGVVGGAYLHSKGITLHDVKLPTKLDDLRVFKEDNPSKYFERVFLREVTEFDRNQEYLFKNEKLKFTTLIT